MKRIIVILTLALVPCLLLGALMLRPAHAQSAGAFMNGCSAAWTSPESWTYLGHTYTPKKATDGHTTACIGQYGDMWILAYVDGNATNLTMIRPTYPLTF